MAETSAEIVEGKATSDSASEVAVGWTSGTVDEETSSLDEVDRLGRSRAGVALSKSVTPLGNSSEALETIASVVLGDRTAPLEIVLLRAVASASVLTTLEGSIERLCTPLLVVSVGNKVSDTVSSETGIVMVKSVGAATGSSDALVIPPITPVRLPSMSEATADICIGESVAIIDESMVVLRAIPLVSVGSSCVSGSVGSSRMLDGDG